ncbi:MAG TPA: endonuclease NucS domain-containing protein [Pyrinomonadaceae bacterium]|nr:endonuclease NucS domain-containing protein [Pyrinomonadaceae bacterium]
MRELLKAREDRRVEVWEQAVSYGGPITARRLRQAVLDRQLLGSSSESANEEIVEAVENPIEFVREKDLEEFMVNNFEKVFGGGLCIYENPVDGRNGQQYPTSVGPIDILATDPKGKSFVVIELKKARSSDHVVGQVLRYMGWVRENLCKDGQSVKGLVVSSEPDPKLTYALRMTRNIDRKVLHGFIQTLGWSLTVLKHSPLKRRWRASHAISFVGFFNAGRAR